MKSEFDELKRFAIADVLSVSGKEKTTSTIEKHIDNIIDVAIAREQHQQSKVDELQYKAKLRESDHQALLVKYQATKKCWEDISKEKDELQKRVDAVKRLAQTLWEKSEKKHQQGKVWESKTLGECADEILDVLEQALKGGLND